MYQMGLGLPAMQAASSSSRSRPPGQPGSSSPLCSLSVAHQGFHPLVPVGVEIYIDHNICSFLNIFLTFKNAPKIHNCLTVWVFVHHASSRVLEGVFEFPNDPLVHTQSHITTWLFIGLCDRGPQPGKQSLENWKSLKISYAQRFVWWEYAIPLCHEFHCVHKVHGLVPIACCSWSSPLGHGWLK